MDPRRRSPVRVHAFLRSGYGWFSTKIRTEIPTDIHLALYVLAVYKARGLRHVGVARNREACVPDEN